jgi:DNA-binding PadR family transcriptional regulator
MGEHRTIDLDSCPCGGNSLDRLVQPSLLTVLAGGPIHGYGLAERLREMGICCGRAPDMAGIYRTLQWMEEKGLVASTWEVAERGPAKRSYELTSAGRECLAHWIETLEEYRTGINALIRIAKRAIPSRRD